MVNHVFVLKDSMEIRESAKQSRSPTPFIGGGRIFCTVCTVCCWFLQTCPAHTVLWSVSLVCFFNQSTGGAGLSCMDETGSTTANGAVGFVTPRRHLLGKNTSCKGTFHTWAARLAVMHFPSRGSPRSVWKSGKTATQQGAVVMTVLFSVACFIRGEFFKELQAPVGKKSVKRKNCRYCWKSVGMFFFFFLFFYMFPRRAQRPHGALPSVRHCGGLQNLSLA